MDLDALNALHAYEKIPLATAGYLLGAFLILIHGLALIAPDFSIKWAKKLPRHALAGQIAMGIGLAWFLLLVAPDGLGALSSLRIEMEEFQLLRQFMPLVLPVVFVLLCLFVKEFLFVRGLGLLGLMVVAPLLSAAFLKEPNSRILIPIWCYGFVIPFSLFWISSPYLLRNQIAWASASMTRWKLLSFCGFAYGVAALTCAILWW